MFLTMLKKRKGRSILLDLPLKEDGQLRRFAREKGLTPTAAARLLVLASLGAPSDALVVPADEKAIAS